MILHPELRALRRDDSPQRHAQEALIRAMAQWRGEPGVAAALGELQTLDAGCALDDCPALSRLFAQDSRAAAQLTDRFVSAMVAQLSASPLGHIPLRHFTDGTFSTLLLARSGCVTLSLTALDGEGLARRPAPRTVDFGASEVWERVLAGSGRGESVVLREERDGTADWQVRAVDLRPGTVVHRIARREALLVREVSGALVVLRLQRRANNAAPTREYRLSDGKLVHQAAGDPRDSRIELAMALLGRMNRQDAAPHMARIAREPRSTALRWQALRECLALDARAGFEVLTAIADDGGDPLAVPASAMRAQLLAQHPQLAGLEPCPV